jgi:phosphoglycolate phosphatase
MKRYELLVFDWDGTLVDSAAHIVHSIREAAVDLQLPVPSDAQARHIIGLGLGDAMAQLFPDLPADGWARVADRYRHHYLSGESAVALFPGVVEALPALSRRGHLLAVATGKSRRGLDRALGMAGLEPVFHATRCGDEGFPKPHPDMLLHLLEVFGVAPEGALMIGDTTHDLEMAAAAGVSSLAVTYGAHPAGTLRNAGALAALDAPADLFEWLHANA